MNPMKPSNAEWLGDIPEYWNVARLGDFYKLRNEKVSDEDYAPLSVTMNGIVPQLATAAKSDDHNNRKLVKKGDFAINSRSDRRGSCGISPYDGSVSLINTILTPRGEMNPDYYNWLFHTEQFADEFYKWGHGIVDDLWTTRWQEMKSIMIVSPPVDEQKAIANYLDDRCSKIDAIIAEAKASIEEYKELKQAVIYEAVTKGLDKNVEMKDSGIEWIGKIPKSWGTPHLSQIAYIYSGGTPNRNHPEYWNGNIPWLKTGELKNNEIFSAEEFITKDGLDNSSAIIFPENTILMAMYGQGKTRGMTAILKTPCATNQACAGILLFNDKIETDFLWICLMGAYNAIRQKAVGAGQPNLSLQLIGSFKVTMPSLAEQKSIVEYVKNKNILFEEVISEKQSLIEDLESYKKSLIYEVVTGKRKVVA